MSALNLDDFGSLVERPDAAFERAAEERRQRLVPPAGSLGRLEELADWLAGAQGRCPTGHLDTVKVVLFAGDHGVAAQGVSARAAGDTARLVRNVLDGEAPANVLARRFGAQVRVVDMSVDCDVDEFPAEVTRHRVRRSSGRIDIEDALTAEEAELAFRAGMAVADEEADSGTDLVVLGDLSVGGTTVASLLVAALCGTDAAAVTGRGSGIDDLAWMRKCAAIRDALRRARPVLGDQLELLATSGGADFAAMAGFLLQCAVRRTPVLLDGLVSAAAALVAQRVAFRAPDWWRAAQATSEPAHAKALDRLAMEPLADHGVKLGEAVGALLALPLLQAAAALLAELPERPGLPDLTKPAADDEPAPIPWHIPGEGEATSAAPGPASEGGATAAGSAEDDTTNPAPGVPGPGEGSDQATGTDPTDEAPEPGTGSGETGQGAAPTGGSGQGAADSDTDGSKTPPADRHTTDEGNTAPSVPRPDERPDQATGTDPADEAPKPGTGSGETGQGATPTGGSAAGTSDDAQGPAAPRTPDDGAGATDSDTDESKTSPADRHTTDEGDTGIGPADEAAEPGAGSGETGQGASPERGRESRTDGAGRAAEPGAGGGSGGTP